VTSQSVNGAPVSFGYDADGLLGSAGPMTISREAATGRISGTALGVVTTAQSANAYGEAWTTTASVSGSAVYFTSLTRDLSGKITGKTETIGGATSPGSTGRTRRTARNHDPSPVAAQAPRH